MDSTVLHECAETNRTSGGKRGMVRVGGSASRTISDSNTPDPGGGHHPAWIGNDRNMTLMDPDGPGTLAGFPSLGSLTPAEKDRRDHAVPDRAPAMVDKNSNLDPLWRPEWDGCHQAPLGRFCDVHGGSGGSHVGIGERRG